MAKKILFARIESENDKFIRAQMKKFNYPTKSGKSEFVNDVFSALRNKRSPSQMGKRV